MKVELIKKEVNVARMPQFAQVFLFHVYDELIPKD